VSCAPQAGAHLHGPGYWQPTAWLTFHSTALLDTAACCCIPFRVDHTTDPTVLRNLPFVSQLSGSSRAGLPEAAFRQVAQPVVANLPGMASNAKMWS
jgi:hypothetical protein